MTWQITRNQLKQESLLNTESLFSLGNGYLGVRGNFEEGYDKGMKTIRGTYINGYYELSDITYGEKHHGYPDTKQKLVNIIDSQSIEIYFGKEEERFSLFEGKILSYHNQLYLDRGFSERIIHWQSPSGKEVKLHFRRVVSFNIKELFAIEVKIELINFIDEVKIISKVNGEVYNFFDPTDPRVNSTLSKLLEVKEVGEKGGYTYVLDETLSSKLQNACVTKHECNVKNLNTEVRERIGAIDSIFTIKDTKEIRLSKWNVYTDTIRHTEKNVKKGIEIQESLKNKTFEDILIEQKEYLDNFWNTADIIIDGDESLQEGIRFNLYHLLQSAGKDGYSSISAKGLSGEGYEGHYFWDTEIYMFPVFLLTNPEIAKQLLLYRYSTLPQAKERAKEMGYSKGALYPWRTISGEESSAFFPAGTAQHHISADIAYSFIQYYLVTKDEDFLENFAAEVLIETARLWMEVGHFYQETFRIDAVTGPDEYTCLVNNNYYTNTMAKYNLLWATKVYDKLKQMNSKHIQNMFIRMHLKEEEVRNWEKAAKNMYLPYDEMLKINPQDDTFLQKDIWDFGKTPKENYPLLLHYHPLTLYRYQVCKQADVVLAHFLLEDEQSFETMKHSYDYYEKITTHDSSLSSCIFSIMASKIGYAQKSYDYFIETARLDLDNTHGNTKDGLHMANIGGTWLSIVYGFAGFRLKEDGISLSPLKPDKWDRYAFRLQYQGNQIYVEINKDNVRLKLEKGSRLIVNLYDEKVLLEEGKGLERERKVQERQGVSS